MVYKLRKKERTKENMDQEKECISFERNKEENYGFRKKNDIYDSKKRNYGFKRRTIQKVE